MPKPMFKKGDIITGLKNNPYAYTTHQAVMKVLDVRDSNMDVLIISSKEYPEQAGERYNVTQRGFKHTDPKLAAKWEEAAKKKELAAIAGLKKLKPLFRACKEWKKGWADLIAHNKDGHHSTASFIVLKNDKTVFSVMNGGCHSSLQSATSLDNSYVVSWVRDTHPDVLPFLRWLRLRSPYSHFILNTSAPDILRRGIVVRTDVPANLLAQLMVSTRQLWEYKDIVSTWNVITKGGINPTLAFALAHSFTYNEDTKSFSAMNRASSHNAMDGDYNTKDNLVRMLSGKPANPLPNYEKHSDYHGIFTMWGDRRGGKAYLTSLDYKYDMSTPNKGWDGGGEPIPVASKAQFITNMKLIEADIMKGVK